MKCIFKRRCHRITDHLTDSTPTDQTGSRKQNRPDRFSALFAGFLLSSRLHIILDIIRRAAPISTVQRIFLLVDLRQGCLCKCSTGTDQRHHPHPENRTCSSNGYRCHNADQIAHSHSGRRRHDQRLKRGKTGTSFFLFYQCTYHIRQHAKRHKSSPDCKINSGRNQ